MNKLVESTTRFPIKVEQVVQLHTEAQQLITHRRDVTCSDVLLSFQSCSQLEFQLLLVFV